jgi:hypothetical protein
MDSGIPFTDQYMYTCMQAFWRDNWGFENSLPSDCTECFQADGGGLLGLADFVIRKHPRARLAAVSSHQDEIIRLFFGAGLNNCSGLTSSDPVAMFLAGGGQPAAEYQAALDEVRGIYANSGRLATYLIGGLNISLHQHIWRQRFYEAAAGGETIAGFIQDFMDGNLPQVGP